MNTEKFSDAMNELNLEYVDEAICYPQKKRKNPWVRWISIAACFALAAGLALNLLRIGFPDRNADVATLDNGDKIIFAKSDTAGGSLSLDLDATTRELTEEEVHALFGSLPVTASAIFTTDTKAAGSPQQLIGFEGKIGDVKLIVSACGVQLLDAVIVGDEKTTEVAGIPVSAGYFLTAPNSTGEQTAIYYASFPLGTSTIYVENAGIKSDREAVKNDLALTIQKLINHGELDLTAVETSEVTAVKHTVEAQILEVHPNALLIEPFAGTKEQQIAGRILVSTDNLAHLDTVAYLEQAKPGDLVRIGYLDHLSEGSKAQIKEVYEIVPLKK